MSNQIHISDEAKKYGITHDGQKYCYKSYKYDQLKDALNYAIRETAQGLTHAQRISNLNSSHSKQEQISAKNELNLLNPIVLLFFGLIVAGLLWYYSIAGSPQKSNPDKNSPSKNSQQQLNWQQGMTYYYSSNPKVDAACRNTDKLCITPDEYRLACQSSSGITKGGAIGAALSGGINYLYTNGSLDDISIQWRPEYGTYKKCRVFISVSGIVNGNSQRKQADVGAEEFILNSNGKLLINSANNYGM